MLLTARWHRGLLGQHIARLMIGAGHRISAACVGADGPFIQTLKENFLWVHTFDTIEELRQGLLELARHDNATWMVAKHGDKTPD